MSSEVVTRLKAQILAAFDKAPAKYKLQEGEGHVLTVGLNPRDLSKICIATAPLQHLAAQLSSLFQQLLPQHKFSTITVRDSAGRDLHKDLRNSHYPQAIVLCHHLRVVLCGLKVLKASSPKSTWEG